MVAEAISAAQAVVDAALSARYQVPLSEPVAEPILHITADLAAAWALDTTFSGGGEERETRLSDHLRKRATEQLDQVADGRWRGLNTMTSRGNLAGGVERSGVSSTTYRKQPVFRDPSWIYGPSPGDLR